MSASHSPIGPKRFEDSDCEIAAGVLHHLIEVRTHFLDRDSVDFTHLVRRDGRDAYPSIGHEGSRRHGLAAPSVIKTARS